MQCRNNLPFIARNLQLNIQIGTPAETVQHFVQARQSVTASPLKTCIVVFGDISAPVLRVVTQNVAAVARVAYVELKAVTPVAHSVVECVQGVLGGDSTRTHPEPANGSRTTMAE